MKTITILLDILKFSSSISLVQFKSALSLSNRFNIRELWIVSVIDFMNPYSINKKKLNRKQLIDFLLDNQFITDCIEIRCIMPYGFVDMGFIMIICLIDKPQFL